MSALYYILCFAAKHIQNAEYVDTENVIATRNPHHSFNLVKVALSEKYRPTTKAVPGALQFQNIHILFYYYFLNI